jgi:hypothetical protein
MSHVPNSAMPHAGPAADAEEEAAPTLSERASKLTGEARALLRDNPRTAAAAGAALVAGAIAAVAIPKVRAARRKPAGKTAQSGAKKSSSKKKG